MKVVKGVGGGDLMAAFLADFCSCELIIRGVKIKRRWKEHSSKMKEFRKLELEKSLNILRVGKEGGKGLKMKGF